MKNQIARNRSIARRLSCFSGRSLAVAVLNAPQIPTSPNGGQGNAPEDHLRRVIENIAIGSVGANVCGRTVFFRAKAIKDLGLLPFCCVQVPAFYSGRARSSASNRGRRASGRPHHTPKRA